MSSKRRASVLSLSEDDVDEPLKIITSKYKQVPKRRFQDYSSVARGSSVFSVDRNDREEVVWTTTNEGLIKEWRNDILNASKAHLKLAKHFKSINFYLGFICVVFPIALGLTEKLIDNRVTLTILLVTSGILNAALQHIAPGKKSQNHFTAEARYNELGIMLDRDMSLKKGERPAADVYLERILQLVSRLGSESPPI